MKSKVYNLPAVDISVNRLLFKLDVKSSANVTLYYSKEGRDWVEYKTLSLTKTGRTIITAPKHLTTSEYRWRLTSTEGSFDILEYRVEGLASAQTRDNA